MNTEEVEGDLEERASLRPPEKSAEENGKLDLECTDLIVMRAKMLRDRSLLLTQMLTVYLVQFILLAYITAETYNKVDLEFS